MRLIALLLAVAFLGCVEADHKESSALVSERIMSGNDYLIRYTDKERGIVCYATGRTTNAGIWCYKP